MVGNIDLYRNQIDKFMQILFWSLIYLVFFTYIGYPISLRIFKKLGLGVRETELAEQLMPSITFVVAAYNEANCIREKIENTLRLKYAKDKFKIVVVTDGSNDETPDLVAAYQGLTLYHQPARRGKVAAINRIMPFLDSEVVVLSDANTLLNAEAMEYIGKAYFDKNVGAVSGEKVVLCTESGDATAGEGMYWKYESTIKKWDSELNTLVGCAGELMSFRRELYQQVEEDTYIEDFVMSMRIAAKGFRVVYCPQAKAHELPSASIDDEMKRKVRIAAGGLQAIWRLRSILNPFRYGLLTYQYIGHRVLRWTLTPMSLPLLFIINLFLVESSWIYVTLLIAQSIFYGLVLIGRYFKQRKLKIKGIFIPYYFAIMNYAVFLGLIRLIKGRQKVTWEKAERRLSITA